MLIATVKFDKKKAVFWVIMAALVIVGIILLAGAHDHGTPTGAAKHSSSGILRTEKARVTWLAENGWEVETPALSKETVLIPREFSPVFETYNKLQKEQGFDLSQYCGMEVDLYTYRVVGSDLGDEVVAVLYLYHDSVIGGDVHSTALDGFMCGVKQA